MTAQELKLELFEGRNELSTPPVLLLLTVAAAVMTFSAVWLVFMFAPTEKVMGFVQKIFYFHVPSAWLMFLGTLVAAIGSVGYLSKRTDKWDRLADAGVELAVLFGVALIITGPLWGRKAWGAYWVWDVRLTSSLVLVLTLISCKIVRGYAGPSAKQVSAGLAIFAVLNSIFVYFSVSFWRGTHPPRLVEKGQLHPDMKSTFWFCVLTFLVIFTVMLWTRLRQAKLRTALDRLHAYAAETGLDD